MSEISQSYIKAEDNFSREISKLRVRGKMNKSAVRNCYADAVEELTRNFKTKAWEQIRTSADNLNSIVSDWVKTPEAKFRQGTFGLDDETFRIMTVAESEAYLNLIRVRDRYLNECDNQPKSHKVTYTWTEVFCITKEDAIGVLTPKSKMGYTSQVERSFVRMIEKRQIKDGLIGTAVHDLLKKELPDVYSCKNPNAINRAFKESGYNRGAYGRSQ